MLTKQRKLRKTRVRGKIKGTAERPRLSIFRSNRFVYAQAIDDVKGLTLAHAKDQNAEKVGKEVAAALTKKKINAVVFDRSGYQYHGKVKAVADTMRENKINL